MSGCCDTTVFVYGTLKQGEPNESVLTDLATGRYELLGKATTLPAYPLIVASKYNIPFCLKKPGKGHRITGEVYNVDATKLKALDELEAHPTFYCREIIQVEMESGKIREAWIYLLPTWKPKILQESSEMLTEYSSKGAHGREYVTRAARAKDIIEEQYNLIDDIHFGSEATTDRLQHTLAKAKRDLDS